MNRKIYERFYSYGAHAHESLPQGHDFHQQRYANFQQFLDANPGMTPVRTGSFCCQQFILSGGAYNCHLPLCHASSIHLDIFAEDTEARVSIGMRTGIFDHSHAIRLKGVRKSYIGVTHPYHFNAERINDYPKGILQGLVAKVYPKEKDWYVPGSSNLILISTPETLTHLDLSRLGTPTTEILGTLAPR